MESTARELVESFLRVRRQSNEAQAIWPSENVVIDRLLEVGSEMEPAYSELLSTLPVGSRDPAMNIDRWCLVMDAILGEAAVAPPEKIKAVREAIKESSALTADIQKAAANLSTLLRQRTRILEKSGIQKEPADHNPIDLFESAARIATSGESHSHTHSLFKSWVQPELDRLQHQFDYKYWPRMADMIEALADAQEGADIYPGDEPTKEAVASRKASVRDFMRSLDTCISQLALHQADIEFSHATYATIVNCVLGLDAEVEPHHIKTYRATERKRNAAQLFTHDFSFE